MEPIPLPGLANFLAAGSFLALLCAVLLWMLGAPRPVAEEVDRARRSVDILRRILVPTVGAGHSERGVELACRLAADRSAEILLAYVIEVPRTLPLTAPLTGPEQVAEAALRRAVEIVQLHGLHPKRAVARARVAGEEIVRLAREWSADLIVMGIRPRIGLRDEMLGRTSDIVLRRAPCEVLLDKVQADSEENVPAGTPKSGNGPGGGPARTEGGSR